MKTKLLILLAAISAGSNVAAMDKWFSPQRWLEWGHELREYYNNDHTNVIVASLFRSNAQNGQPYIFKSANKEKVSSECGEACEQLWKKGANLTFEVTKGADTVKIETTAKNFLPGQKRFRENGIFESKPEIAVDKYTQCKFFLDETEGAVFKCTSKIPHKLFENAIASAAMDAVIQPTLPAQKAEQK